MITSANIKTRTWSHPKALRLLRDPGLRVDLRDAGMESDLSLGVAGVMASTQNSMLGSKAEWLSKNTWSYECQLQSVLPVLGGQPSTTSNGQEALHSHLSTRPSPSNVFLSSIWNDPNWSPW